MTQALTTLFSLATIVCAFMFEGIRQRGGILIDARFVTVAVFAVCFGIVPIGVQFLEPEQFGPFDWALVIDRAGASFSMATGMGLLGLLVFFRAYKFEWP
ncbi:MAG: hypothetical protein ACT4UP_05515, partial [Gammaproteobacteria bacterium]